LNGAVVLRYRLQLEAKKLAASTINVRIAAVRRLAYEAANTGLLSPELIAGIRRVKGVPQLGSELATGSAPHWQTTSLGNHHRNTSPEARRRDHLASPWLWPAAI
jgi:hypothetical protein